MIVYIPKMLNVRCFLEDVLVLVILLAPALPKRASLVFFYHSLARMAEAVRAAARSR